MRRRLIPVGVLVASVIAVAHAQDAAEPELAFEVASVKPTTGSPLRSGFFPSPGRFTAENVPAQALIGIAYRGLFSDIKGVPGWAASDRYDVNATVNGDMAPERISAMLRTLLRERFNFASHFVTEKHDVLALVRAKPDAPLPPGMKIVDMDCRQRLSTSAPIKPQPSFLTGDIPPCYSLDNGAIFNSGGTSMEQLASRLRSIVGQLVIDDTGLPGYYRFQLRHARPNVDTPLPGEENFPEITTALQEQLGLKLVSRKADVKVLVVDRFDRPTPD